MENVNSDFKNARIKKAAKQDVASKLFTLRFLCMA